MSIRSSITLILAGIAPNLTFGHVSITCEVAYAGSHYETEFTVPHGCNGSDTQQVELSIPSGITGIRPLDSTFGPATIESNAEGNITKLIWTKSEGDLHSSDSHAYNFSFRSKLPDTPFTTYYFPTIQSCKTQEGQELEAEWVGTGDHHHSSIDSSVLPAPKIMIFPKRFPGWNKYTVNQHVHDLTVFSDAEIVWMGGSAYSANPETMALIEADANVNILVEIHPDSIIWVKY